MESDDFGPEIWGGENNPANIPDDAPGPGNSQGTNGGEMPIDPNPTDKPEGGASGEEQGAIPESSSPSEDGDELMMIVSQARNNTNAENTLATVNVSIDFWDEEGLNAEFGSNSRRDLREKSTEALNAVETILSTESDCSKWFGPNALAALKAFRSQLLNAPVTRIDSSDTLGIRQKATVEAPLTYYDSNGAKLNNSANAAYRLFSEVQIQSLGPYNNNQSRSKIGGNYAPASLQSRIAQILHEIAHLTYKDGKILIENDGENGIKSGENTAEILDTQKCKDAIDSFIKNQKAERKKKNNKKN